MVREMRRVGVSCRLRVGIGDGNVMVSGLGYKGVVIWDLR